MGDEKAVPLSWEQARDMIATATAALLVEDGPGTMIEDLIRAAPLVQAAEQATRWMERRANTRIDSAGAPREGR